MEYVLVQHNGGIDSKHTLTEMFASNTVRWVEASNADAVLEYMRVQGKPDAIICHPMLAEYLIPRLGDARFDGPVGVLSWEEKAHYPRAAAYPQAEFLGPLPGNLAERNDILAGFIEQYVPRAHEAAAVLGRH